MTAIRIHASPTIRRISTKRNSVRNHSTEPMTAGNGLKGLGQVLKSFRDSGARFPPYQSGAVSAELNALGVLDMPASAVPHHPQVSSAKP